MTSGVKPGATVIRMLIDFWVSNDSANVLTRTDIGIFMGTTEGIAAGAVPEPSTSGDNPGWMFRHRATIVGTAADVPEAQRVQKDIRSMRKFGAADRDVALVVDASSGSNISVNGLIRLLIKLL